MSPRQMLEISALPYSLELPGAGKIFTLECEEHGILLSPANGMDICLNGRKVEGKTLVTPGDKMRAGGYLLDFHFKHKTPGIAFSSRALSLVAKLAVVLFILCELAIMLGLTSLLSAKNLFEGSMARQRISYEIIRIQKKIEAIKTDDPMEVAMLALLNEDMSRRMNYIGDFGDMLSPRQRKNMANDLRRLDLILDKIAEEGQILPAEKVKYEDTVKNIIERNRISAPK